MELNKFKSLQILSLELSIDDIPKIILYLASKFPASLFKRMNINLNIKKLVPLDFSD